MQPIVGARETTVDARGLAFHCLEWGAAASPPMVLLHGLTGHARTWDHVAPALAHSYHVFVPDQRGHGDTSHAETYATRDFVDDLDALAGAWGIERFVLVGLSMGAHNAMAYAAAHPGRVARLVVIDIPPKMDRTLAPNWDLISRRAETGHPPYANLDEAFAEARAGNATAPDDNLRYRTVLNLVAHDDGTYTPKYDAKAPARWDPEDLTSKLAQIAAPTLIVRGGLTIVLPRSTAERMTAMIPDALLVEVPESGHSVPTDRPEDLAPLILDWLSSRAG